jgi:hypothetical protein
VARAARGRRNKKDSRESIHGLPGRPRGKTPRLGYALSEYRRKRWQNDARREEWCPPLGEDRNASLLSTEPARTPEAIDRRTKGQQRPDAATPSEVLTTEADWRGWNQTPKCRTNGIGIRLFLHFSPRESSPIARWLRAPAAERAVARRGRGAALCSNVTRKDALPRSVCCRASGVAPLQGTKTPSCSQARCPPGWRTYLAPGR